MHVVDVSVFRYQIAVPVNAGSCRGTVVIILNRTNNIFSSANTVKQLPLIGRLLITGANLGQHINERRITDANTN